MDQGSSTAVGVNRPLLAHSIAVTTAFVLLAAGSVFLAYMALAADRLVAERGAGAPPRGKGQAV
jgi:hypothetical protein